MNQKPDNNSKATQKTPVLTTREQEIFDKLLAGTTGKNIAAELNISYDTVSYHRKKLYKKLGVSNIMELFTKYKTQNKSIPVPMVLEEDSFIGLKPYSVPVKILIPAALAVFVIVFILMSVFTMHPPAHVIDKSFVPVVDPWYAIMGYDSTSQIAREDVYIEGKMETVVTISGFLYDNSKEEPDRGDPFSGAFGRVFGESLEAARTMNTLSFKVMGDGNRYFLRLPTFETIEGDHFIYIFPTVKDEISNVSINIPDDLFRMGWSGKDVPFIQNNIMFIQFQTVDPGYYTLKIWDFRFNQ